MRAGRFLGAGRNTLYPDWVCPRMECSISWRCVSVHIDPASRVDSSLSKDTISSSRSGSFRPGLPHEFPSAEQYEYEDFVFSQILFKRLVAKFSCLGSTLAHVGRRSWLGCWYRNGMFLGCAAPTVSIVAGLWTSKRRHHLQPLRSVFDIAAR